MIIMGKFSNPRGGSYNEPEDELAMEFEMEPELPQQPCETYEQFDDFSDITLDAVTQSQDDMRYPPQQPPKRKNVLLVTVCAVAAVLLIGIIGCLWFTIGSGSLHGQILENVTVAGVNIGGMKKEEAIAALSGSVSDGYAQDMVIELPDTTLTLPASDSGIALDMEAIVDAAYEYGRSGSWSENRRIRENAANTSFAIDPAEYLVMNEAYIRGELDAYCAGYNSDFAQSTVTVNGEVPILDTADENFDPEAPGQTVTVYLGIPGRYVDPEALYAQVTEAYKQQTYHITAGSKDAETLPDDLAPQLQELYDLHAVEAVDAAFDTETYEAIAEVYGYAFDLEAALQQIKAAAYGDTLEFVFEYIQPELTKETLETMLFRDELAYYQTTHTNNANRNTNLKLACASLNGVILMPGEQFDYNTTLGKRTTAAGYKAADAYSGGKTVQTIGGGICQVSSTLYYCTLLADLQIDSRKAHSFTSSYMPLGMDATVSWGGPEFRFTNNTGFPIRIEAEVSGGYVKIKLIGTDVKDYYVKMEYEVLSKSYAATVTEDYAEGNSQGYRDGQVIQTAYNGCTVQSYKCKYDKETDELISREKEALSQYKKRDKIVVNIIPKETEPPATEPKPTESTKPTETPTTEPKPTEAPATEPKPTEPPATEPQPTEAPATEAPAADTPAAENTDTGSTEEA